MIEATRDISRQELEGKSAAEVTQVLESFFGFTFHFNGEPFQVSPKYYEEETVYPDKDTIGVVFEIRDETGVKAGEVVGYLYADEGKRKFLVQYSENRTHYGSRPMKGLIRNFTQELMLNGKIHTWISSADLNDNSTHMYRKLAENSDLSVTKEIGADFRNPDLPSYTVTKRFA